jgi:hypothetical protein
MVKTKKAKKDIVDKKLPKGFRFNATLNTKYGEQPLFKEKVERANHILKTVGLPKI